MQTTNYTDSVSSDKNFDSSGADVPPFFLTPFEKLFVPVFVTPTT